jgi:hypothetical protein
MHMLNRFKRLEALCRCLVSTHLAVAVSSGTREPKQSEGERMISSSSSISCSDSPKRRVRAEAIYRCYVI